MHSSENLWIGQERSTLMERTRFKRSLLGALALPGVSQPFRFFLKRHATIFMLHRFEDPEHGVSGFPTAALRQALAWLRRHHYPLLSLDEVFSRLEENDLPRAAVAFTIDDGYLDQATVGAPVFAEFDCPVTTFLTSGFLDAQLWFWWDHIEYVFRHTRLRHVKMEVGGQPLDYAWENDDTRMGHQKDLTERCKRIPDAEKHAAIERLAIAAEVTIPESPPGEYAPMTWEDARRCEGKGMTFGPHTVTHPILSQTPDEQSAYELKESWKRLTAEVRQPVPVFCYPNGGRTDFGPREVNCLRTLGIRGAVVGEPGYASVHRLAAKPERAFSVERFVMPDKLPITIQYAAGVERLKELIRNGRS
jgi:peptidoglycan/xylan/chitin deacetylase (PgdA/CDA1 family)